jgi:hypothetical protein
MPRLALVTVTGESMAWATVRCASPPGSRDTCSLIASTDGGRTWTWRARATPPGAGWAASVGSMSMSDYLAGIAMRPSGVGLAWEGRGGTIRTADGGRTWQSMPPGGSDAGPIPVGGWAITDRNWLILQWDGNLQAAVLYATTDAGVSWGMVARVPGPTTGAVPVPALTANHPTITVTPAQVLKDGQTVLVQVTGMGDGGKVWVSECGSVTVDARAASRGRWTSTERRYGGRTIVRRR